MLSSDILEKQFGPTNVVALKQTATYRYIQTISQKDHIVLELSCVTFDQTDAFPLVHTDIVNGASIGKTFTQAGIAFVRHETSITKSRLSPELAKYFDTKGMFTIVNVSIFVGIQHVHYCDIVEIYSPVVVWPHPITDSQSNDNNLVRAFAKLL